MFNCASFETDFGGFGSFKKIVFFILDSVFALDEYDREYIRELTRVVTVDFFSLSRHYVTELGFGANQKMASFIPAQTHTLTTSGSLLLDKVEFLTLLISSSQQESLTILHRCSKSSSKSKSVLNKDKKIKRYIFNQLKRFNTSFTGNLSFSLHLFFE